MSTNRLKLSGNSVFFTFVFFFLPLLVITNLGGAPAETPKIYFGYFSICIFLVLTVLMNIKKELVFNYTPWLVFSLVTLTSMLISCFGSGQFFLSFFGFFDAPSISVFPYLVSVVICATVFNLLDSDDTVNFIFDLIISSATISSIYGLIQLLGLDPFFPYLKHVLTERAFSTFGNATPFGIFAGVGGILSLTALLSNPQKRVRDLVVYSTSFLICTLGIFSSGSRGPMLLFILSVLTLLVVAKIKGRLIIFTKKTAYVALTAATGFVIFFAYSNLGQRISERFQSRSIKAAVSLRLEVAKVAIKSGFDHPLIGHGPSFFASAYYKYRPASHNLLYEWDSNFLTAHNSIAEAWVTRGFLGVFILFSFVLYVGYFFFKTIIRIDRIEQRVRFLSNFLIIFLISANSLTMFSHFNSLVLLGFFLNLILKNNLLKMPK